MIVFKSNQDLSKEEWEMWRNYIEENYKNNIPLVMPDYFDIFEFEEGEEIEIEEEWEIRLFLWRKIEVT